MVINTTTVRATAVNVASESVGETIKGTAHSVAAWLGRTCTKVSHAIKDIALKVWSALVEFFKNFPQSMRTGYGVGAAGVIVGGGLLTTAICLKKEQSAARAVLVVAASAFFFAAGAFMFAFKGKPVAFGRAAV